MMRHNQEQEGGAPGTAAEIRVRDVRWLTRIAIILGLVAVLFAQVSSFASQDHSQHAQDRTVAAANRAIDAKDGQIAVLRQQRDSANTRADTTAAQALVERTAQRALVCDEFDRLARFSSAIATLISDNPNLTAQQQTEIDPYISVTPRPVECPPTQAKP